VRRNEVDGSEKRRKAARERRFEISSGICILQRQRARARERQEEAWQARKAAARSDPMLGLGEGRKPEADTTRARSRSRLPHYPFLPLCCLPPLGRAKARDRSRSKVPSHPCAPQQQLDKLMTIVLAYPALDRSGDMTS